MARALALARRGRGTTRPNPMVGAVVVRGGRVVGEGFHRRAGTPHAEIHALAGLGKRAVGATIYVTLEPCCHTGRTAPCTTALINADVARVVVGVRDPNPLVNGRGVAVLRRAGIRVDVGCLQDQAQALNLPFFTWVKERRPLVTLKAAATLDGFIAPAKAGKGGAPIWITGAAARAEAHVLRDSHDAILVGAGTVLADNPRLTVRLSGPRRAAAAARPFLRVVLDGRLRTPATAAILPPAGGARTLVVGASGAPAARVAALRRAGAAVVLLPARKGRVPVARLLATLAAREVQSLLVEGGGEVHAGFIAAGAVDRVAFFVAPRLLGGGVPVTGAARTRTAAGGLTLGPLSVRRVGQDLVIRADVRHEPPRR